MTQLLYETDFSKWALTQADALRNEEYADLDRQNLIEEIEDMARSERKELHNVFVKIIEHLLKLECEPNSQAVNHWKREVQTWRIQLRHMVKSNASLKAHAQDYVEEAYQDALIIAATGADCSIEDFPAYCRWTADHLLDLTFWPNH